jgi:uncharacterized membrane protein
MKWSNWSDERFERIIGNLLSAGVFLSASIVLSGGFIYLTHFGKSKADYAVFRGEPDNLKSAQAILRYALEFHGRGIIQLGLLLLIATPVARVAFSIFGFALQGDRMYVIFTLTVLLILLYSLFGSAAIA